MKANDRTKRLRAREGFGRIADPSPKRRRRRGIVLLIVISLLALFVLMGITYSLVVSYDHSASRLVKELDRVGDPPETEVNLVLGQLLFDTQARTSLQYHSLLRDLYGTDSVTGTVAALNNPVAYDADPGLGQIWQFRAAMPPAASQLPYYYCGRVLTFLTGSAANRSTRVVGSAYDFSSGQHLLQIESLDVLPAAGDTFLINGAPFNGAGAGYDPITRNVDAIIASIAGISPPPATDLINLLPHFAGFDTKSSSILVGGVPQPWNAVPSPLELGGLDETWDAVDIQNMYLAMVPPRAAESYVAGGTTPLPIIPSFHRPELVNYWTNFIINQILVPAGVTDPNAQAMIMAYPYGPDRRRGTPDDPTAAVPLDQLDRIYNLTRGSIFRPMPWDHPNFSGSNAAFATNNPLQLFTALINATNLPIWDVDNDNDGVPDSIWIDPGLPIVTAPDGKRYKRLAAILIKDLDGSININAHGNLAQVAEIPGGSGTYPFNVRYAVPAGGFGLAPTGSLLPRGIGFGPAEVDFLNILGGDYISYGNLLRTRYESRFAGDIGLTAAPGVPNVPGQATFRDPLSAVKHGAVPNDFANLANLPFATWYQQPSWYASPPDVWGRGAVAIDYGGQPVMAYMGQAEEMRDQPYEMALGPEKNSADSPYTLAELERVLRYHDVDAQQLPARILTASGLNSPLATESPGVIGASHHRRNSLTTISSHIPVPATTIPQEKRNFLATLSPPYGPKTPGNATILDLYRAKLIQGGAANPDFELQKIVPWEFFKGQKFDLNRWLGDGLDNNTNGARDDVLETIVGPPSGDAGWAATIPGLPANFAGVQPWHMNTHDLSLGPNPGVPPQNVNFNARQLYARHLFCLAMLFLPDNFQPTCPHETSLSPAQYRRLIIRRIAQWAINCVDFRDPDAIMTPFEFDYNPWDGWQVDGNLITDGGFTLPENPNISPPLPDPTHRGLVWGMEYPELLITETLAFHDRRVKDTDKAGPGDKKRTDNQPDEDLDQFGVPQGSLFVELYCPRPHWFGTQQANQKPALPLELYDTSGNLVLGRFPAGSTKPIWRLALAKVYAGDPAMKEKSPYNMYLTGALESASFDPGDVNLAQGGTPNGPMTIERYVYFGSRNPAAPGGGFLTSAELPYSFYNSQPAPANNPLLPVGDYAVVGPRTITYLGSQDPNFADPPPRPGSLWGGYSKQYIELDPASPSRVAVFDTTGRPTSRTTAQGIRPPVAIIADTNLPSDWTNPRWRVGMNITEPVPLSAAGGGNYYPEPTAPITAPAAPPDLYDDPEIPLADGTGFKDIPLDSPSHPTPTGRPIAENNMTSTGTYTDCSTVFLQRLANPTLPYNPLPNTDPFQNYSSNAEPNPYITVDWATIDVTVFTGEENTNQQIDAGGVTEWIDPDDKDPDNTDPEMHFRTRQRGFFPRLGQPPPIPAQANPWSPMTFNGRTLIGRQFLQDTPRGPQPGPYFKYNLSNDLTVPPPSNPPLTPYDPGYPAGTVDLAGNPATKTPDQWDLHTLGYLNEPIDQLLVQMYPPGFSPRYSQYGIYAGEPARPFPWVTWHNRPFASPMELLLVPSSSPSRFCFEVTPGFPAASVTADPYPDAYTAPVTFRSPFAQLLNFFESSDTVTGGGTDAAKAPHFNRLLDYVEVPSPYVGTERWFNPQHLAGKFPFAPPFNKMSRFRDPGRININTIFDPDVWDAAVGIFPDMNGTAAFALLARSRRGYQAMMAASPLDMDQAAPVPTRFANPFRTADSADLMPPVPLSGNLNMRQARPVDATLLRPRLPGEQPLFVPPPTWSVPQDPYPPPNPPNPPPTSGPPGPPPDLSPAAYHDINRNPYFRYQALQKIGNIFSTTSNCFAVWITIGYFEVEPTTPSAANPDGFMLGQELGADSGETKRHRAFFIIDRSIPVGFMPGKRLNTDECILVRRLIE